MKHYPEKLEPMPNDEFEARIVAALQQQPEPAVPDEFAARVVAALPPMAPVRRKLRVSRVASAAAAVVLLVAMIWLAPHSSASFTNWAFDGELLLTAELAALSAWVALRWENV